MAVNQKQRFIVVGGIVLIAILAMLAFFSANTAVKVMTVAEAASPNAIGQRVEVTGNVVNNSFDIQGDILTFAIADPDDPGTDLRVQYDRGVSATFGNGGHHPRRRHAEMLRTGDEMPVEVRDRRRCAYRGAAAGLWQPDYR